MMLTFLLTHSRIDVHLYLDLELDLVATRLLFLFFSFRSERERSPGSKVRVKLRVRVVEGIVLERDCRDIETDVYVYSPVRFPQSEYL